MNQVATKSPQAVLNGYFQNNKAQLAAALPKHLNPDRMSRLALTAFSQNKALQACDPKTIFSSIIVLSQLGLEPGIDGQAYLVPYKNTCTPIPGWKGYVDLVSRAGRATVWTGAVFEGDDFDYQLGDMPYLKHRPGDENDESKLTHVYAVGRVKGAEFPVIEVWTINKIKKHRDKYNKVGKGHYSFTNLEMYARKIPLLQVLKYMPKSVELQNAMEIEQAAAQGKTSDYINGDFVTVDIEPEAGSVDTETGEETIPPCSAEEFAAKKASWIAAIQKGRAADDMIAMIETKYWLTDAQKAELKGAQA